MIPSTAACLCASIAAIFASASAAALRVPRASFGDHVRRAPTSHVGNHWSDAGKRRWFGFAYTPSANAWMEG